MLAGAERDVKVPTCTIAEDSSVIAGATSTHAEVHKNAPSSLAFKGSMLSWELPIFPKPGAE
jgi:hypothetical protein